MRHLLRRFRAVPIILLALVVLATSCVFADWVYETNILKYVSGRWVAMTRGEIASLSTGVMTFGGGFGATGATFDNNGNLYIDGIFKAGGGYGFTGFSCSAAGVGQFNGALTTDGLLTAGSISCGAALAVGGAATLTDALDVTGATSLGSTANVVGNFSVNTSVFTVNATSGDFYSDGDMWASGDGRVQGDLTVDGNCDFNANMDVFQDIVGHRDLTITRNVSVGGTLGVTGVTTLASLAVTGALTADSAAIGGGYSSTGLSVANTGALTTASTILADSTITSGKVGSAGSVSVKGTTSGGIDITPIGVGTGTTTIQNGNTAGATITLPGITSTLAILGANTFTGVQAMDVGFTVDTDALAVADGTGIITLHGTATIDNNTDLAVLNLTETTIRATGILDVTGNSTLASADIGGGYAGGSGLTAAADGAVTTTSTMLANSTITSGVTGTSAGSFVARGSTSGGITVAPIAVGTNTTTIQNQAGTIIVTLPSATCTLPGLGLANIWSASQALDTGFTVDTDALAVADGTGIITLHGSATIDNNTDLAVLNLTETTVRASGILDVTGNSTLASADVGGGYAGGSGLTAAADGALTTTATILANSTITSGVTGTAAGSVVTLGATSGGISVVPIAVGGATATIQNQNVAASVITLPGATCTLPGLGLANIWSANQEIDSGFTVDDDAFAVADTTGILTLHGGGTINNNADLAVMNLTEDTVRVTGILDVTGNSTLASLDVGGGYGVGVGATISAAGVGQFNGALTTDGVLTAASITLGATPVTSTGAELNYLAGITPGAVTLSKAIVVDASKDISSFRNLTAVSLKAGESGAAGTIDVFPATGANGKITLSAADSGAADHILTISNDAMGDARALHIPDSGIATAHFALSTAALTPAEVDVLDAVTPGTVTLSKAVVVDGSKDISSFNNLTAVNLKAGSSGVTGTVEIYPTTAANGNIKIAAVDSGAADHILTIQNAAMADARTYTIPDVLGNASFVMTEGAQTINGVKTFSGATAVTTIAASGKVVAAGLEDTKYYWHDDFDDEATNLLAATTLRKLWWTGGGAGTQTVTVAQNGTMVLDTAHVAQNDTSTLLYTHEVYSVAKGVILEAYVQLDDISDAQAYLLGFYDDANDYLCFEFDDADDANHISVVTVKAGAAETRTDTTVHLVAGTYIKLRLEIGTDGSYATYINGTAGPTGAAGTITVQTTNQPYFQCKLTDVGHTAAKVLTIDYIKTWQGR